MPWRNRITITTRIAPCTTSTHAPGPESWFCIETITAAPTTGPNTVPMPPTSAVRTTSPDIRQVTSVSDASWNISALVAPATPARVTGSTNAGSL